MSIKSSINISVSPHNHPKKSLAKAKKPPALMLHMNLQMSDVHPVPHCSSHVGVILQGLLSPGPPNLSRSSRNCISALYASTCQLAMLIVVHSSGWMA